MNDIHTLMTSPISYTIDFFCPLNNKNLKHALRIPNSSKQRAWSKNNYQHSIDHHHVPFSSRFSQSLKLSNFHPLDFLLVYRRYVIHPSIRHNISKRYRSKILGTFLKNIVYKFCDKCFSSSPDFRDTFNNLSRSWSTVASSSLVYLTVLSLLFEHFTSLDNNFT